GGDTFNICPGNVSKGNACTSIDPPLCYKTCGPEKQGLKSETCDSIGVWVEMAGCAFDPSRDYSCYRIPATGNTACGASVTPIAGTACDVPQCTTCNSLQGATGGQYFDSAGATRNGYCVCQAPNSSGMRTWSCASDTSWPCPGNSGC